MAEDLSELAARRLTEYVELWESVMARMADSQYHSEDLVDDWFSWWGKVARDSTAAAAFAWRAYGDQGGSPPQANDVDER
jgi:hypothetical protein